MSQCNALRYIAPFRSRNGNSIALGVPTVCAVINVPLRTAWLNWMLPLVPVVVVTVSVANAVDCRITGTKMGGDKW